MLFFITLTIISICTLILALGLAGYLLACMRRRPLDASLLPPDSPRTKYARACIEAQAELSAQPHEELYIRARDGKRLYGELYHGEKEDAFVILVHGYHSTPTFDFGTMGKFYLSLGYSLLFVTQRAHGKSDGMLITYGGKEGGDLALWAKSLADRYPRAKILLHGVSMGGATALLATGHDLPENVRAVVDDCTYTCAFDEIAHVAKKSFRLPRPCVHAANLWSLLLTGVDLRAVSPKRAGARCTLPKLYIHGDADTFVPYYMGEENYTAAAHPKHFVRVEGARHAMSFFESPEEVGRELAEFAKKHIG